MTGVALAGLGPWGCTLARSIVQCESLRLVAVCDTSPGPLEQARRDHPGACATTSLDAALGCPDVDALVVATPSLWHADCARRALAAGKHVFVEKPLALNPSDANELVALARGLRRVLFVGHLMVHHPAIAALQRLVHEGVLGEPRYLEAVRSGPGRKRPPHLDEGVLWTLAPHDIAVAMHLLGEAPVSVSARGVVVDDGAASGLLPGGPDVVVATLRFPSGTLMSLRVGRFQSHRERRLTCVGARAMARFEDRPDNAQLSVGRHGEAMVGVAFDDAEPLAVELRSFSQLLEQKPSRRELAAGACAGEIGAEVVAVLAACQRSLDHDGVLEWVVPR